MNTARKLASVPTLTRDQIMEFTPAERMDLGTANGIAVPAKHEKVKAFLQKHTMSDADKLFCLELANERSPTEKAHAHTASFVNSHGGQEVATATQVKLLTITGQTFVRPNTVIPLPYDVKLVRPVMRLSVMTATYLQVKNKKIVPYWNFKDLQRAWKDTTVNVAGIARFQASMTEILEGDKAFMMKLQGGTSSVSSDDFLLATAAVLNRCPLGDYIAVNQVLVYEVFRFYEKRVSSEGKVAWRRLTVKAKDGTMKPLIPQSCLMTLKEMFPAIPENLGKLFEQLRKDCRVPQLLFPTGFIDPSHTFQEEVGTLEAVIKAHQIGVSLRVGGDSGTSRLYDMEGWTGLADDFGKRVSLSIAMVLGVREHFKLQEVPDEQIKIDLQLESTGDAAIIAHSLSVHIPKVDWKLKIPKSGDWSKIHRDLYKHLIESGRVEAVYVKFSQAEFQTFPSMGDYRVHSDQEVPRHKCAAYVMYVPIFGPYWWHNETKAKREASDSTLRESNSFIPLTPPPKPVKVYSYGTTSRLKGIVTTLPRLSLVGKTEEGYISIDLKEYDSEAAWYKKVIHSMGEKNCYWVNPTSHFSPITNLVLSSRATVMYARTTPVTVEDAYSGDVALVTAEEDYSDEGEEWVQMEEDAYAEDIPYDTSDNRSFDQRVTTQVLNVAEQIYAHTGAQAGNSQHAQTVEDDEQGNSSDEEMEVKRVEPETVPVRRKPRRDVEDSRAEKRDRRERRRKEEQAKEHVAKMDLGQLDAVKSYMNQ